MYAVHQEATMVPLYLESENYKVGDKELPALQASASVKNDQLNLTVCNLNPNKDIEFEYTITGDAYSKASGKIITGEKMNSMNDFGKEEEVTLQDFSIRNPKNNKITVTIPSKSVVLVTLSR